MFSASGSLSSFFGWSMIHIMWVVALLYAAHLAVNFLLRSFSAHIRYVAACVMLMLMVGVSAVLVYLPFALDRQWPFARQFDAFAAATGLDPIDRQLRSHPNSPGYYDIAAVTDRTALRLLARSAEPVVQWIGLCWGFGVLVRLAIPVIEWCRLSRIVRTADEMPLPFDEVTLQRYRKHCGKQLVPVYHTSRIEGPFTIGWLRPVILMPLSLAAQITPDELFCILAHEVAHIRRRDFVVNVIQIVTEALLFFHPCVWLISRRIRVLREACCDDSAVEVLGCREVLGRTLHRVEGLRPGPVLAMEMSDASIPSRILRLQRLKYMRPHVRYGRFVSVLVAVLIFCLLGATPVVRLAVDYDDQAAVAEWGASRLILQEMGLRRDNPDLLAAIQRLPRNARLRKLPGEDLEDLVAVASRGANEDQLMSPRLTRLRLEMSPTYSGPEADWPADHELGNVARRVFDLTLLMPPSPRRDKWFNASVVLAAQETWGLSNTLTNTVRSTRFAELSDLPAWKVTRFRRLTAIHCSMGSAADRELANATADPAAYARLITRCERPLSMRRFIAASIAYNLDQDSPDRAALVRQFQACGTEVDQRLGDLILEPLTGVPAYVGRATGNTVSPPFPLHPASNP